MNYKLLLNPSETSRKLDVATFNKWENRKIDTKQCIENFIYNNSLRKKGYRVEHFDEYEFGTFLRSLGYLRDLSDLEKGVYNQ